MPNRVRNLASRNPPMRSRRNEQAEEEEQETAGPADEDLVRLYLRNIGKRKLLTAADERVIGARMEQARAELLVALADLPAPRQALIRMAAALRNRELEVPELILNPDGKPVTRAGVTAVLAVIDALARSDKRQKLGAMSKLLATRIAALPIRPSVVEGLERGDRAGLTTREFDKRLKRVACRAGLNWVLRSTICSRPTSGSWCRWPRNTQTAGSRCWISSRRATSA